MQFPQWVVDRVIARQGVLHPYEQFDAARTAFVVIDMQRYFTEPGFLGQSAAARDTFPSINRLSAALRQAGGLVVWVQTMADDADVFWSHHHRYMLTPERSARRLRELHTSHPGHELAPELNTEPSDLRVIKRCYSALSRGSSELDEVLRANNIDTLLIGGTATNACCESTARDAMMMDYRTVMVDDALSAYTEAEHIASLQAFILFFGDVLSTDEFISRLQPAPTLHEETAAGTEGQA